MNTWTVASTSRCGLRAILDAVDSAAQASEQLFAAAGAMINRAGADERPRYTLHLGDQLAAIFQTGDDELGLLDHAGAANLLTPVAGDRGHILFGHLGTQYAVLNIMIAAARYPGHCVVKL
jgi:hypothetical protein